MLSYATVWRMHGWEFPAGAKMNSNFPPFFTRRREFRSRRQSYNLPHLSHPVTYM
jgi:hypothetical protein